MSTPSTLTDSPVSSEPLHDPSRAAQVVVPRTLVGNNTDGQVQFQKAHAGVRGFLSKEMSKANKFVSPTDSMMTPCSQKISAAKKNRFGKPVKPMQRLVQDVPLKNDESSSSAAPGPEQNVEDAEESTASEEDVAESPSDDTENPF